MHVFLSLKQRIAAVLFVCLAFHLAAHGAVQSLVINVEGKGSVVRNPSLASYPKGAVVGLTATPDAGWKLGGWEGDGAGTANPLNLLMDADKTVTARFVPLPTYSLTIQTEGSGRVSVPSGNYSEDSTLVLSAAPASGWVFAGWFGDVIDTRNPLSLLIRSNTTITARFGLPPRITVQPVSATVVLGGKVTLGAQFNASSPLTLQWFFNDAPIASLPFPSLTIGPVTAASEGDYYLVVSNAFGVARSDAAHVSVIGDCSGPAAFKVCDEASLRQAVGQGGLIQFCCNGTILLTSPLEIAKDVGLDARNQLVVLDGGDKVRLIHVHPGVRFGATNVSFTRGYHEGTPGVDGEGVAGSPGAAPVPGGNGEGGAIYNELGNVTLVSCQFVKNRVQGGVGPVDNYGGPIREQAHRGNGYGGALLNHGGNVVLINSSFRGNTARDGDSRLDAFGGLGGRGGEARGGALYSRAQGSVWLTNVLVTTSAITVHSADGGHAKGGAFYLEDGSLTLLRSTLTDNRATADAVDFLLPSSRPARASGGAIFVEQGGLLTLVRTEISTSKAQGSQAARHSGTGAAAGGGIYSAGDCLIQDCLIRFNSAFAGQFSSVNADGLGGGLYSVGKATVLGTTFQANRAAGGDAGSFGAIFPDYIPGNAAGGGIYTAGALYVTNSTFALNTATGGARVGLVHPSGDAYGGGIYNSNGLVRLMNVTLAANQARSSLGEFESPLPGKTLGGNVCNASGSFSLRNTLLDQGEAGGNGAGSLTDDGFNMSSDASCQFASGTSFNLTNPKLLALADNGGPTPTMALGSESPAIDFGTSADAPLVDQRGSARPVGGAVDIGAYEQGILPKPVTIQWVVVGSSGEIRFEAAAGTQYELFKSVNLVDWERLVIRPAASEAHPATFLVGLDAGQNHFYRVDAVIP